MNTRARLLLTTALVLPLLATGCDNPPRGDSGGRIDITRTTAAESANAKVLPFALVEFSDYAAQELMQDLSTIPTIQQAVASGQRATVIVGDINNQTGIVTSDEFELMRSRLRNNLLQSRLATSQLKFVENRARVNQLRQREMVLPNDGPVEPTPYEPQTTFALNGDFYRIGRGSTNQYYMEFQLVHFGSNEIVFSKRYDVKQMRHRE